jgi:hypothetical protein
MLALRDVVCTSLHKYASAGTRMVTQIARGSVGGWPVRRAARVGLGSPAPVEAIPSVLRRAGHGASHRAAHLHVEDGRRTPARRRAATDRTRRVDAAGVAFHPGASAVLAQLDLERWVQVAATPAVTWAWALRAVVVAASADDTTTVGAQRISDHLDRAGSLAAPSSSSWSSEQAITSHSRASVGPSSAFVAGRLFQDLASRRLASRRPAPC